MTLGGYTYQIGDLFTTSKTKLQKLKCMFPSMNSLQKLLLSLLKSEKVRDDSEMPKKLENIIKAVLYAPGVLHPSAVQLVKHLLLILELLVDAMVV